MIPDHVKLIKYRITSGNVLLDFCIIENAMLEHGAEQIGSCLGVGSRDVEYKFRGKVVGIFVDGVELGEEELA